MNLLNSSQFSLAVSTISSIGLGYYIWSSNSRLEEQIHLLEDRLGKMDQLFRHTLNTVSESKDENQNVIKKLADDVDSTRHTIALLKDATEVMAGKMGYIVKKKSRKNSRYSKKNVGRRSTAVRKKNKYRSDTDNSSDESEEEEQHRKRHRKSSKRTDVRRTTKRSTTVKKNSRRKKYEESSDESDSYSSTDDDSSVSDESEEEEEPVRRKRGGGGTKKSTRQQDKKKSTKSKKDSSVESDTEIDDIDALADMLNNMNQ